MLFIKICWSTINIPFWYILEKKGKSKISADKKVRNRYFWLLSTIIYGWIVQQIYFDYPVFMYHNKNKEYMFIVKIETIWKLKILIQGVLIWPEWHK